MIGNSFLKQIAMLALAAGMMFMYVKPNFANIGETQNKIVTYQSELARANQINAKLDTLIAEVNSISAEDMKKLMIYLPSEIDHVAISRDIYNIAIQSGLEVKDVKYEDSVKGGRDVDELGVEVEEIKPTEHNFLLSTTGSYTQIKNLLINLSQNDYPLEVAELKISSDEIGLLTLELMLNTYSSNKI